MVYPVGMRGYSAFQFHREIAAYSGIVEDGEAARGCVGNGHVGSVSNPVFRYGRFLFFFLFFFQKPEMNVSLRVGIYKYGQCLHGETRTV